MSGMLSMFLAKVNKKKYGTSTLSDDFKQLLSFQYKYSVVWNKTPHSFFIPDSINLVLKTLRLKRKLYKSKKYKRPIRSGPAMLEWSDYEKSTFFCSSPCDVVLKGMPMQWGFPLYRCCGSLWFRKANPVTQSAICGAEGETMHAPQGNSKCLLLILTYMKENRLRAITRHIFL